MKNFLTTSIIQLSLLTVSSVLIFMIAWCLLILSAIFLPIHSLAAGYIIIIAPYTIVPIYFALLYFLYLPKYIKKYKTVRKLDFLLSALIGVVYLITLVQSFESLQLFFTEGKIILEKI